MGELGYGSCVCCTSKVSSPHLKGLRRCPDCSHVWADMRLTDDELRDLYARDYFEGGEYPDYEREKRALIRNFRAVLKDITRIRPEGGRLWEIGCAYGYFLYEASRYFRAAGCDLSPHAVEYACDVMNQAAQCSDYLSITMDEPPDVVCMWDTIEHLAQPDAYIAKAYDDLAPGGVLALSTGDIGAIVPRLRGAKWRLIHPPTHLHYFTVGSMGALLERTGFQGIRTAHRVFWRDADGMARRILAQREGGLPWRLYEMLHKGRWLDFAIPFQTFDLMVVYARKAR